MSPMGYSVFGYCSLVIDITDLSRARCVFHVTVIFVLRRIVVYHRVMCAAKWLTDDMHFSIQCIPLAAVTHHLIYGTSWYLRYTTT